ncbi:MAG: DUF721 domain-containing protein [Bacteroidales bacterium]
MNIKGSNELTLKEIIDELLKVYKLEDGIAKTNLINSWEDVTGAMISKHTERIYVKRKTLYIKLDSQALKHELSFAKSKLIKQLNKAVKKEVIDEIVFL